MIKKALVITFALGMVAVFSGCANQAVINAYSQYRDTVGAYAVEKIKADTTLSQAEKDSLLAVDTAAEKFLKEVQE